MCASPGWLDSINVSPTSYLFCHAKVRYRSNRKGLMCRSDISIASAVAAYLGQTVLSANRAVRSNRYIWISGPITTVRRKRICRVLAAVGRIGMLPRRWISDKITSAEVVLGNHPIGVRRIGDQTCWFRIRCRPSFSEEYE